jgi:hypothetical protein
MRRIDEDKRQPFPLKESQCSLSLRFRKPIPISELDGQPLITKKRSELLKLVELVFALDCGARVVLEVIGPDESEALINSNYYC